MKRPALALLSAILVTAGSEAKAAACTCEGLKSLQNELKLALILRDKHAAKAHDLREKYGAPPKDFAVNAARRDYEAFEAPPRKGEKPAPGSARDGLPPPTPGAPQEIKFVPRGAQLRDNAANNREKEGIPEATKWVNDYTQPDLPLRREIEEKHRKAGKDLCAPENEAAMKQATTQGSVCDGIAKALQVHEAAHRDTCQRLGFYAFNERHAYEQAEDEVKAYRAQVDVLAGEIRRVLKQKKTKITSGSPGPTPESLLGIEVRCALAFSVAGQVDDLKFSDKVCDSAEAFTVKTSPNANFQFTPNGEKTGTYAYNGRVVGAQFYGSGSYALELQDGKGTLKLDGSGRWNVKHPMGNSSKSGPESLRATELPEGCN
ncbi:hypothetical protein [Bosea vaviloviae]|uniref:Lysozyme inhibitor LprI N-terminal domain-containing protein n=1 Tax=Bosea vaviloviae TaxID=1526658 RepID=A0A1D7U3X1_9HYPH|nr:hypothetical protein [Bosea vaviloviae]AOO82075.1 hypothetical protein BHK69_17955 [Bosea vaviloviae]